MKSMKIRPKLLFCFAVVILLTAAVGIIGILGLSSLNKADIDMYNHNVSAIDALGSIRENYALQRIAYRNLIIYDSNSEKFKSAVETLRKLETEMDAYIKDYQAAIIEEEDIDRFNKFLSDYNEGFKDLKQQLELLGRENKANEANELLSRSDIIKLSDSINENMYACYDLNVNYAKEAVEGNTKIARQLSIILVSVFAAALILSVIISLCLAGSITKPLDSMREYLQKVVSTGDMTMERNDVEMIDECYKRKDEISLCSLAVADFINRVFDIGKSLETIAGGDLSIETPLLSEHDTIGLSMRKMTDNLNDMFGEVTISAKQVSAGSKQTSEGAQSLAQGSTEQASAIEELSSSIMEVAGKTEENARKAEEATGLANSIKKSAEKGSNQMNQMLNAVQEIREASQNIGKVIKVIDDIAFQTNILALNAAVEAARAGQHGKGFAVVAEEVRNLAAKSAEAAKTTGSLITDTMEKAELGANIANETAESLSEIVTGINESSKVVNDITISSEEQATAISQINKGIEQVAQVVQKNSAASEESAAASEEMSKQADVMEALMERFKLRK